jgi:uncharacterized iron-regulated membrane protein
MMRRALLHKKIRKWHRYLGLVFGIQFLLWTLGGLFFSWTDIGHIRGDDIRKEEPWLRLDSSGITPAAAISTVRAHDTLQYITGVQLVTVLDSPYYQVVFFNGYRPKARLVNAATGRLKPILNQQQAIAVAQSRLKNPCDAHVAVYITKTDGHHEYRKKPLPVYAVSFKGSVNSTVYVSPELGTVQSYRNNQWRLYDVLWMLHTMDFEGRSNFNNTVLRFFSAAGLLTILSGFALYWLPRRRKKKIFNTNNINQQNL